jgi:hypothetical protein
MLVIKISKHITSTMEWNGMYTISIALYAVLQKTTKHQGGKEIDIKLIKNKN